MDEREFRTLFSGLCCSQCRNDFDFESLISIERDGDLRICRLKCHKCGKDFGDVILNFNNAASIHSPLEIVDGPPPINADDVINAHEFIKKNL